MLRKSGCSTGCRGENVLDLTGCVYPSGKKGYQTVLRNHGLLKYPSSFRKTGWRKDKFVDLLGEKVTYFFQGFVTETTWVSAPHLIEVYEIRHGMIAAGMKTKSYMDNKEE